MKFLMFVHFTQDDVPLHELESDSEEEEEEDEEEETNTLSFRHHSYGDDEQDAPEVHSNDMSTLSVPPRSLSLSLSLAFAHKVL